MSFHLIAAFITTFLLVSLTPGMCMTLAMSLGMTIGIRRTCWMMFGELLGVGIVAVLAVIGVATVMLNYPLLFTLLKYAGGAYLIYLGYKMWRTRGDLSIEHDASQARQSRRKLFSQGFITAIANPKGWAFMISLLPPFIDTQHSVPLQLTILVAIILCTEFFSMMLYASGGQKLSHHLKNRNNLSLMNRISGSLMAAVGVWLASS